MSAPPVQIAVLLLSLLSIVTASAGVLLALLIRDNTRAIAAGAMVFVVVLSLVVHQGLASAIGR